MRLSNVVQILDNLRLSLITQADMRLEEVRNDLLQASGKTYQPHAEHSSRQIGRLPLLFAAAEGYLDVVKALSHRTTILISMI
jgi:hypothetical protein